MKQTLLISVLLCAVCANAAPPVPYAVTVDSDKASVPALEAYQAIPKVFRVSFVHGTNSDDITGATPWMWIATGATARAYYTSTVSVVSYPSGICDFAFSSQTLNWTGGMVGVYAAGVTDTDSTFRIYRQGSFVVRASAFGAGVPLPTAQSNIDCSAYNWLNPPWSSYTNAGYSKSEADSRFATGTPVYVEEHTGDVGTLAGYATGTPVYSVSGKLDSNTWSGADSTTNYARRTGDTVGPTTNRTLAVGNSTQYYTTITYDSADFSAGGGGYLKYAGDTVACLSDQHLYDPAGSGWLIDGNLRVTNVLGATNLVTRAEWLASNTQSSAATTNYVRRTGDTITGHLRLTSIMTGEQGIAIGAAACGMSYALAFRDYGTGAYTNTVYLVTDYTSGDLWVRKNGANYYQAEVDDNHLVKGSEITNFANEISYIAATNDIANRVSSNRTAIAAETNRAYLAEQTALTNGTGRIAIGETNTAAWATNYAPRTSWIATNTAVTAAFASQATSNQVLYSLANQANTNANGRLANGETNTALWATNYMSRVAQNGTNAGFQSALDGKLDENALLPTLTVADRRYISTNLCGFTAAYTGALGGAITYTASVEWTESRIYSVGIGLAATYSGTSTITLGGQTWSNAVPGTMVSNYLTAAITTNKAYLTINSVAGMAQIVTSVYVVAITDGVINAAGNIRAGGKVISTRNMEAGGDIIAANYSHNMSLLTNAEDIIMGKSAYVQTGGAVAIGELANGGDGGVAVGTSSDANDDGVAIGLNTQGNQYGVAVGSTANGNSWGVAVGYGARAETGGVAVGSGAIGKSGNIAIGSSAKSFGSSHSVAIGVSSSNSIADSTLIRGTLYLDGGSNVYYRTNFGAGAWTDLFTDRTSNFVAKTGDTMSGALLTTRESGFAGDELVPADWVRSLFEFGAVMYHSTSLATDVAFYPTNTTRLGVSELPATDGSSVITITGAHQYVSTIISTVGVTDATWVGPATVEFYAYARSGTPAANYELTVHPEFYYVYDKSGQPTLGDWSSIGQTVTTGSTNLYRFTIAFPNTDVTGTAYRVVRLKVGSMGANATNLTIFRGPTYPSRTYFRETSSEMLGTRGATGIVAGASDAYNVTTRVLTWNTNAAHDGAGTVSGVILTVNVQNAASTWTAATGTLGLNTNDTGAAETDPIWAAASNDYATVTALGTETNNRIGADTSLSNSLTSATVTNDTISVVVGNGTTTNIAGNLRTYTIPTPATNVFSWFYGSYYGTQAVCFVSQTNAAVTNYITYP